MARTSKLEPMSNIDSFWLNMDEPTNLMIITGVMEFDEMLDFDAVKNLFEQRLLKYERFKQKVVWPASELGRPYWAEDPNFDIRNHMTRVALPTPRDKATLQRMISDLTVVPLDKTKPLWKIHIIENYGSGCVMFMRLHHAIGDGIAMMRLMLYMCDPEPNYSYSGKEDPGSDGSVKKSKQESGANLFMQAAVNTAVKATGAVYKEVRKSIATPMHLAELGKLYGEIGLESATILTKLALMPSDSHTSLKGKLGVQKSACWSSPMQLTVIKELCTYYRCTVNDVLIAAVSGAIRRYLLERGDDLDDVDIRVSIPVNVRSEKDFTLGNQFSLVVLSLPVGMDDPVRRLRETRKRMRSIKESADAFVGFQMMKLMGAFPQALALKFARFFASKFTGVLSNVPGPKQPLYFTDKMVKNLMFWVPRSGDVAIGISIMSYAGQVTLGIATDNRVAPDPEKITQYFNEDFSQLMQLAKEDVLRRSTSIGRVPEQS